MSERSLTVGGLPGTGTTTLCRLLSERLGMSYTYAGELFRAEADRRGMSLAAFGALCEEDPSADKSLDEKQVQLLRRGGLILEGRLAGWHAYRHVLPSLRVWLKCQDDERFRRLAQRDGGSPRQQKEKAEARQASERARYEAYYGIDLTDTSIYDLVLDSTRMRPEVLADMVESAWHA